MLLRRSGVSVSALILAYACWAAAAPAPTPTVDGSLNRAVAPDKALGSTGATLTSTQDAAAALTRFQIALDQLTLGNLKEARVILDDSARKYGDLPEWNLLLAYLLQREGRTSQARERTAAVAANSLLAATWTAQLTADGETNSAPGSSVGATTAPAANSARLAQTDARLTKMEQLMVQMVNEERKKQGLGALRIDETLAECARAHSAEMRDRKYFAHESPTPAMKVPLDRYKLAFNKTPTVVAENIYSSWGSPRTLNEADIRAGHNSLMESPGHRANILYDDVTHIGIGIVANATGDVWITQMFSRPSSRR